MTKFKEIALILAAVLLTSCAETPENLKENKTTASEAPTVTAATVTDEVGNVVSTEPTEIHNVERGNIDVIRAQLESDLQKPYKNIKILNACVGTSTVMPTYDIKVGANEDFTLEKVVKLLYSDRVDDVGNPKYWQYTKAGDIDNVTEKYGAHDKPFWAEEEGRVLNKNTAGFDIDMFQPNEKEDQSFASFHYSLGNVWGSETGGQFSGDEKYWFENYPSVAVYNPDFEKPPEGLSYKMANGEEWELTEAIAYVEAFWNDYLAESDPDDFEYGVKSVRVKDLGDGTYGYYFTVYRRDRNGNRHDVNDLDYIFFRDNIRDGKPFIVSNDNFTWCAEKEAFTRYKKDYSFSIGAETEAGDSLLTLGRASDILSAALAPNIGLELNAELNYLVVCKSYPYYSIWEYPEYYWDTALTTCDLEIKPFWVFRPADIPDSEFGAPDTYLVNAVSGDVQTIVRGKFEVLR